MRKAGTRYILEGSSSIEARLTELVPGFRLEVESANRHTVDYLDTFDWRLYEAGKEMFVVDKKKECLLSVRRRGSHQKLLTESCQGRPRFASDLPSGPARQAIASITDVRALLPIVRVWYKEQLVRVLNADSKTVTRLWVLSRAKASEGSGGATQVLPDVVTVTPVLGYEKQAKSLCRLLEQAGLKKVKEDLLDLSLAAIGREPMDYASKPRIILDRRMTMDAALRTILVNLYLAMRANEAGLQADIDIEFLHDFRVANRRTRSVIGQFKRGMSGRVLKRFRPGFKWLGKVTGPTRDADVYLEKVEGYCARLPEDIGEQLLPLHDFLERKRAVAFKSMLRSLKTKRYSQLMSSWESFLLGTDGAESRPLHKARSVVPTVSARIWKVYRTIMKQGRAITPTTPATALHNLRLVCKNLRYLLEIFRSLYPAGAIGMLISELKVLQNNLGDVQDLELQRLALDGFAREMLEEGPVASGTVMAMGRLAASLEDRQRVARAEFAERFSRFARKRNRQTFQRLFKDQR